MRASIAMLILGLMSMPVCAEISYEALAEMTDQPMALQGDFEQKKTLTEFDASVTSIGEFTYKRHQSIEWVTTAPVENTLLMTPEKITSQQNKNEILNIDANKNPTARVLSQIFFAIMTADWQSLADYFDLAGEHTNTTWHVTLLPNNRHVESLVTKVILTGDNLLREVTLFEKNGDTTHIRFKNLEQ